jgi:PAS domain S-box-containing protein
MSDELEKIQIDWKSMFENMNMGFAVHRIYWDENGNANDIEYLDVNPSFEKITHLKKENIVGKRTREIMPNLEKVMYEHYGKVVKTGEPVSFEEYVEGLGVYFKIYAFKTGENEFGSIFEDITEARLEKEERVKETTLLNTLIDSMTDYVFYKNSEGAYLLCNEAFARDFVGKSKEEIVDKTDNEIFGPEDEEKVKFILEKDKEVFETGTIVRAEWVTKLASGNTVILETVKTPFKDKTGKVLGLVGVSRDITDRKKLERSTLDQLKQLEIMNRILVDRELKMISLKKEIHKLDETKTNTQ